MNLVFLKGIMIKNLSIKRIAEVIHIISAFWVLVIAGIIFVDVIGRVFFNAPLLGAVEIIKNSVVSIAFLQLPLTIYGGGMLQTTLLYDKGGRVSKKLMRSLTGVLGCLFFLGLAYSSWDPFLQALAIGEYEGEGALRVPTYPVRLLIMLTSIFASFVYLYLLVLDWTGGLEDELEEAADQVKDI